MPCAYACFALSDVEIVVSGGPATVSMIFADTRISHVHDHELYAHASFSIIISDATAFKELRRYRDLRYACAVCLCMLCIAWRSDY